MKHLDNGFQKTRMTLVVQCQNIWKYGEFAQDLAISGHLVIWNWGCFRPVLRQDDFEVLCDFLRQISSCLCFFPNQNAFQIWRKLAICSTETQCEYISDKNSPLWENFNPRNLGGRWYHFHNTLFNILIIPMGLVYLPTCGWFSWFSHVGILAIPVPWKWDKTRFNHLICRKSKVPKGWFWVQLPLTPMQLQQNYSFGDSKTEQKNTALGFHPRKRMMGLGKGVSL